MTARRAGARWRLLVHDIGGGVDVGVTFGSIPGDQPVPDDAKETL